MRVILEERARRVPIVGIDPVMPPPLSHASAVIGVDRLHLIWKC